jgi:hypothetical protein
MMKYLVAGLLIGLAGLPAFAADQAHLTYVANGHPDPWWSLRVQRHRSSAAEARFQSCLARHNYNNLVHSHEAVIRGPSP